MRIPDYLTCLLSLYANQEATVRTEHGTTVCFQIGKGVCQGCILSPCLFNFYAEYIMKNAGLEETHAGIKIARRNINNLRYPDDTLSLRGREKPSAYSSSGIYQPAYAGRPTFLSLHFYTVKVRIIILPR